MIEAAKNTLVYKFRIMTQETSELKPHLIELLISKILETDGEHLQIKLTDTGISDELRQLIFTLYNDLHNLKRKCRLT
jgi:hypothetical protein